MERRIRKRDKHLRTLRDTGRSYMVPAERAQEKLLLMFEHMKIVDIVEITGVPKGRIDVIKNGVQKKCRRTDNDAIMAASLDGFYTTEWRCIATPRILKGLMWAGYTSRSLAPLIGHPSSTIQNWRYSMWPYSAGNGDKLTIGQESFTELVRVAQKLEVSNPVDYGVPPSHVKICKARARRLGHVPLFAWDWETIGDPQVQPDGVLKEN